MPRANTLHTTSAADAPLIEACWSFLAAVGELYQLTRTGQGDDAAVVQRYCAALTGLTQAIPQCRGAYTAKAIAAHLATRSAKRVLSREVRITVAGVMSAEARS